MSSAVSHLPPVRKVRLTQVALPTEHGSWGFLLEPIVAGLAIAFSPGGLWVSLMVIGAFLLRQPLKIVLFDRLSDRSLPQTAYAVRFGLGYLAVFATGLIGSVLTVSAASFFPFAVVLPFAVYQIYCDATRRSRQLPAELIGSVAIASSIAVIALADGWSGPRAYALWAILAARSIASILYVRNRLNLEKGKPNSFSLPMAAHVVAFLLVLGLALAGLSPYLVVVIFAVLLVRCAIGLSRYRKKVKAMKIGIGEVIYGTLTVVSLIIGFYAGL